MWSISADRWASPSKARNAFEVFDQAKDLPVEFWGFKDKGLDRPRMCELVKRMKDAGKTTFLESVHYQQNECLEAAGIALGCDVDYLTGTIYYDSILERVKDHPMKYFPFFGHIHGHPVISGRGGAVDSAAESVRLAGRIRSEPGCWLIVSVQDQRGAAECFTPQTGWRTTRLLSCR